MTCCASHLILPIAAHFFPESCLAVVIGRMHVVQPSLKVCPQPRRLAVLLKLEGPGASK